MGGVIAAFLSAGGAYLVAAKKMSGTVKSSDAEQLWAESRSIREWSTERIAELSGTINALEHRVENLETYNHNLLREKEDLLATIERLTTELSQARINEHEMRIEIGEAHSRVRLLEEQVKREDAA